MRTRSHLTIACLVLTLTVGFVAPANAQGGRAGHFWGPWQDIPSSALEWRTRCDGGPVGVNGGPINWTIQFHNRSKIPTSFDYELSNPQAEKRGQPPVRGQATLKAGKMFEKLVSLRTDACDETLSLALGNVRSGADADSTQRSPPSGGRP